MGEEELEVSTWPHIKDKITVEKIMYSVIIALIPATAVGIYTFGWYVLTLMIASVASALVTEYVALRMMDKEFEMDGSAVVTGLLLALIIPPSSPIWMPVIGSGIGIAIGKCAFGGLGYNVFNPAIVGRLFLTASWPTRITTWHSPVTSLFTWEVTEKTAATPLAEGFSKAAEPIFEITQSITIDQIHLDLFLGKVSGCVGETSALAILIGGIFLIAMKRIDWTVPVTYIGTVAVLMAVLGKDPLFQVLAGGLFFGAFFMATDYATTPMTRKGKILFAVGAGVLVVVIRTIGGYPEGVAFSILIMNGFVPLIDRIARPRTYGTERKWFSWGED